MFCYSKNKTINKHVVYKSTTRDLLEPPPIFLKNIQDIFSTTPLTWVVFEDATAEAGDYAALRTAQSGLSFAATSVAAKLGLASVVCKND